MTESPKRAAATSGTQKPGRDSRSPEAAREEQIPQPAADEATIREALARRQGRRVPADELSGDTADAAGREEGADTLDGELFALRDSAETPQNEDLIREALRNRGKPYIWGGASRGGFDCSGFVCYVYGKMRGMKLPHSAAAQSRLGNPVPREQLQPGDLVFFSTYRRGVSHVGIYIGNNKFIHAANTRKDVRVDTLTGYYHTRYRGARRIAPAPLKLPSSMLSEMTGSPSELPEPPER